MKIVISCVAVLLLAGCSASSGSPGVPSLSPNGATGAAGGKAGGTGPQRKAALHAAAECVRQHGIPGYQDPVLTADGHVYTDAHSFQDADRVTIQAVEDACGSLLDAAQFQPGEEAPAPAALVQAGVRARQCLREHGLTNVKDPTAATHFTPGQGFGVTPEEVANGKRDPVAMQAFDACHELLDEEARRSSLGNLGDA